MVLPLVRVEEVPNLKMAEDSERVGSGNEGSKEGIGIRYCDSIRYSRSMKPLRM